MTNCCRKCIKTFCNQRDQIENCSNCISEVYQILKKIDEKIKE